MGWFSTSENTFLWRELNSIDQWKQLWEDRSGKPIIVFKHSTRCAISRMAKQQFEKHMKVDEIMEIFLLDLLNFRALSQAIADDTGITHESPQVLAFQSGTLLYQASHHHIDAETLLKRFA